MTNPDLSTKGYVTTYSAVAGLNHAQLEDALGFATGVLATGYRVYELASPVGPNDFEWRDRTRYSDGWRYEHSLGACVRRTDELRADLGKKHGYDDAVVDRALAAFKAAHAEKLNVRSGPQRIVKIVPNLRGAEYPDSSYRDIPQWELTVQKAFRFVGTSI